MTFTKGFSAVTVFAPPIPDRLFEVLSRASFDQTQTECIDLAQRAGSAGVWFPLPRARLQWGCGRDKVCDAADGMCFDVTTTMCSTFPPFQGVELDCFFRGLSGGVKTTKTALVCTALSSVLHAHLAEGLYRAKTDQPCYYQTLLIFTQKTSVHESEATFI